jgi:DNA-binding beta-propeller fold protein YncE
MALGPVVSSATTGAVMQKVRMAKFAAVCAVALVSATYVSAQNNARPPRESAPPARHLVYIATPGDNGTDNQSGVVVLDADKDFSFLKRISYDLPASKMPGPKVSGITVSVPLQMLYVTTDGNMMAFDLATDKIAWTFNGETAPVPRTRGAASGCCERPWTLPDGKTLLVGSSYNSWWYYIDGATGKVLGKLPVPDSPVAHNLAVTADGQLAVLGSMSSPPKAGVTVIDVPSRKVLRYMTFSEMVRPLTINHDGSLVYVNVNDLIGFEIGDVKTGKMLKRFEIPGNEWKGKGYSHGIGMTPDESEIWVADPFNNAWQIWDNPGDGRNPVYNPSKMIKPTAGVVHSWISMTNDGKLAFIGDSSVIDVKKHKEIAVMKDEFGRRIVHTEKVLYMTFRDGKLIETNNQFAIGDAKAYAARVATKSNEQ